MKNNILKLLTVNLFFFFTLFDVTLASWLICKKKKIKQKCEYSQDYWITAKQFLYCIVFYCPYEHVHNMQHLIACLLQLSVHKVADARKVACLSLILHRKEFRAILPWRNLNWKFLDIVVKKLGYLQKIDG